MKATPFLAVLLVVRIVGMVTINIQQVYAPRDCGNCADFLKLTAQFEKDVGTSILEFAVENHPNNIPYGEFKKLTGQFKADIIAELLTDPPQPDRLRGALNSYGDGIARIFLGGPDTIPELFQKYKGTLYVTYSLNDTIGLFENPPDNDKQLIKERG